MKWLMIQACSGPGAGAEIANSVLFALAMFVITLFMGVASLALWRRKKRAPVFPFIIGTLLVFNPIWMVSAAAGDCGQMKRIAAIFVLILACTCLVVQFYVLRFLARAVPNNLCLSCNYDLTGNTTGHCPECGHVIGAGGDAKNKPPCD